MFLGIYEERSKGEKLLLLDGALNVVKLAKKEGRCWLWWNQWDGDKFHFSWRCRERIEAMGV